MHLNRHLAGQTLFHQLFEQQSPFALGGVFGHHMGELDNDGSLAFRLGRACGDQQRSEG